MNATAGRSARIMETLACETRGHSYKSHKYSLDESDRSAVEYGEAEKTMQWARRN